MATGHKPRSLGWRDEDQEQACLRDTDFDNIEAAHKAIFDQLKEIAAKEKQNGETLDAIASAFVDKDYVKHRMMQFADMERDSERKKLWAHVKQGLVLSAVLAFSVFVGAAVLTRFATITLPNSAGVSK